MLPTPPVPIYTVKLLSNNKEVRIRPFLVGEEKLLLMAAQSKDVNEIVSATQQVISNCLVDQDIKVEDLPFFDIDYLVVFCRAKSVAETVDINFKCRTVTDEGECGHIFPVQMDIKNAHLVKPDLPNKVDLGNGMGVKFKYPKYREMKKVLASENPLEKNIRLLYHSIDFIYNNDQIYSMKDYSKEDFDKFIEGLTDTNYKKLETWVDNLPSYEVFAEKTCPKCGTHHNLKYDDMSSFFLS